MRTITTTVYLFDELPTDKAKEAAREWMAEVEADRYDDSDFCAVLKALDGQSREDLARLASTLPDYQYPLTGFYAEYDALQAVAEVLGDESQDTDIRTLLRAAHRAVWMCCQADQEASQERGALEETIRANEYEFTETGSAQSILDTARLVTTQHTQPQGIEL
jgi:hypothetical protein